MVKIGKQEDNLPLVFEGLEYLVQAIGTNYTHGFEEHADFAFRETLHLKPLEVRFGKVADAGIFILAEGHFRCHEFF